MMREIFLLILGLVAIFIASIQDLRKREVENWISFSLIVFALAYRAFYSIYNSDLWFFLYGVVGLIVFVGLGYAFYYSRVFAGGDAKLLMALGTILPISVSYIENIKLSIVFIFLLLLVGGVYGLIFSFVLFVRNIDKSTREFSKQFRLNKKMFYAALIIDILIMVLVLYSDDYILLVFPLIILAFPLLFIYGKTIEESCMIREVSGKELTIGDWLYEKIRVKGKEIKPYWEGLSEKEVSLLKKVKKIKIKQGIPFVPSFFIAFIILIYLWFSNWSFFKFLF